MARNALIELPPDPPKPKTKPKPDLAYPPYQPKKPPKEPPPLPAGKRYTSPYREWKEDDLCFVEAWGRAIEYFYRLVYIERPKYWQSPEVEELANIIATKMGIDQSDVVKFFLDQTHLPTLVEADSIMLKFGLHFRHLLRRASDNDKPAVEESSEVKDSLQRVENALSRVMAAADGKPILFAPLGHLQRELDNFHWVAFGRGREVKKKYIREYKVGQKVRYMCGDPLCGFRCVDIDKLNSHAEEVHGASYYEFVGKLPPTVE